MRPSAKGKRRREGATLVRKAGAALLPRIVRGIVGVPALGAVEATLVSTGMALAARRGKRELGIVLLIAGGVLVWRAARVQPADDAAGDEPA